MFDYGLPVFYALFLWWFSTGLIVYLDGLPRHTFRNSMLVASILLVVALIGLSKSSMDASVGGALLAFTCGLMVWAWQELSYFMGYVTGTRKEVCEENCSGWKHFGHALQVNLYHEISIIAGGFIVIGLTWGGANQVGTWTYLLLWWMQLSAKLNVFLGVRNLSEEFLPDHMHYMKSFLRKKSMNYLFPVSVTVLTAICVLMIQQAMVSEYGAFVTAGYAILATIVAMALLEHWLLILPLPATALWNWWLNLKEARQLREKTYKDGVFSVGNPSFPAQALATAGPDRTINTSGTNCSVRPESTRDVGSGEY